MTSRRRVNRESADFNTDREAMKRAVLVRVRLLPDPTIEDIRAAMIAVERARPNGGAA
jgi:hypothetical protein